MFDFPARNSALIAASIYVPRAHTGEIWKIVGHLRRVAAAVARIHQMICVLAWRVLGPLCVCA
jgi:hypothetical protein